MSAHFGDMPQFPPWPGAAAESQIPDPVRDRLVEIEAELTELAAGDRMDEQSAKDAYEVIERARQIIKNAAERTLLRGLELTRLEHERDTIRMVVQVYDAMPHNHDVGYGKPPLHTRFAKGQSGNPQGRPKTPGPSKTRRSNRRAEDRAS